MSWPVLTDYQEAIQNPGFCFADTELQKSVPETDSLGLPRAISGNFAVVFPMKSHGKKWAVRCFTSYRPDQEERYAAISKYLQQHKLPYMVGFEFIRQGIRIRGQWYPILKMEWVAGEPLNIYVEQNLGNPQAIANLARQFLKMVSDLKQCSIAHGDLQHGNILVVDGNLRLVDYDGMYVPGLEGKQSHELGHRHYQHPSRSKHHFGTYLDNFSAWVIYLSLLAFSADPNLWYQVGAGEDSLLFCRNDFENPDFSDTKNALKQIPDATVRLLASSFWSLLYKDLPEIPFLDEFLQKQEIVVPPPDQITPPSGLPDWIAHYEDEGLPETSSQNAVSVPPVPPLEPLLPSTITTSCLPERIFLTILCGLAGLLVYTGLNGLIAPALVAYSVGCELALALLILVFRFKSLPEVIQKHKELSNLLVAQTEYAQAEEIVNRLKSSKDKLEQEEHNKISELTAKQRDLVQKEKNELDRIDRATRDLLADLYRQKQISLQEEKDEINQALQRLQNQYLTSQLSRHDLADAQIPGVGPELKKRLSNEGIKTAADIVNVHIIQAGWGYYSHNVAYIEVLGRGKIRVEGIGPKKAAALLNWRKDIESRYRSGIPQALSPAQEGAIKTKYQTLRQTLDHQITSVKQKAEQNKNAMRMKYKQEQDLLAKQLQGIRDVFAQDRKYLDQKIKDESMRMSEKYNALAKAQQKYDAYRNINFFMYLKRILTF